jgi:hypothetical protein
MKKVTAILLSLLLACFWGAGCGEDSPTDPGGGGGGSTNHSPTAPAINTGAGAPADGATDQSISTQLHWTCSDPDGDALTYDVHFGQVSSPPAVSTGQSVMSYDPGTLTNGTTYYWQIVAEDPEGETTSSAVWSFTTVVQAGETVTAPSLVTGPPSGYTTDNLTYTANMATSSEGHTVEYQFDWGDGTQSAWSTSQSANHSWSGPGTYDVRARARCQTHTAVESGWSPAKSVVITVQTEIVTSPYGITVDDDYVAVGVTLNFDATIDGSSNLGHTLEYQWDFGDGTTSSWAPTRAASHAYAAGGTFTVKIRARCSIHTDIESAWSSGEDVHIVSGGETVSPPRINSPVSEEDRTVVKGENITIYQADAASSMGHDLQYRFDLGDGTISPWADVTSVDHTYTTWGDHQVIAQARCRDHTDIESPWSGPITIHVIESITPGTVSGPATGVKWTEIAFTVSGAASSEGHALEYELWVSKGSQWSWGYAVTGWTTADNLKYTFNNPDTYYLRVRVRCATHTDVEVGGSLSNPAPHAITITDTR